VLFLASQSPQRAMLLQRASVAFTVVPSTGDEDTVRHSNPQALAVARARCKAAGAVLPAGTDGVVLAADTVVGLGDQIIGSPRDRADAVRILTALSGTTHLVATGHCCIRVSNGHVCEPEAVGLAIARVTFRALTAGEIADYVATGESDGRAGAYAVQEQGDGFVADLQGAWDTVVGLSLATVARIYREVADLDLPGRQATGLTRQYRRPGSGTSAVRKASP
jgi:septum formation protein